MNEIEQAKSHEQGVERQAQAELAHSADAGNPAAPLAAPFRANGEPARTKNASTLSWLRRPSQWSFLKLKEDTAPVSPNDAPLPQRHDEPGPAPDRPWSAVSVSPDAAALPETLRKRYLIAEDKFYFRDRGQALAFEDRGTRLVTTHDDRDVAHSMVELAHAKGWTTLRLKGSDEFKREAWLAASLRGLEVRGYRATELDQARLAAEVQQPNSRNVIEPGRQFEPPLDGIPTAAAAAHHLTQLDAPLPSTVNSQRQHAAIEALEQLLRARGDSEQAISMTTQIAADQLRQRRVYVGKLLEHGPARFDNRPLSEHSYFVLLKTSAGEKTLWGVDLERAMTDSRAQRGDDILIAQQGSRPVTVPQLERDGTGRLTGDRSYVEAKRNDWLIRMVDDIRESPASMLSATPPKKGNVARATEVERISETRPVDVRLDKRGEKKLDREDIPR